MKAYQLKITIKDSHPPIWRRLVIPAGYTFSQLTIIINTAMGWDVAHLSQFIFGSRLFTTYIEDFPEEDFMDSFNYRTLDAASTRVDDWIENNKSFLYVYDMGDNWEHKVTLEDIISDYPYKFPILLKAVGACPWEDCGGMSGYYHMLEVMENPEDEEYNDIMEWTGGTKPEMIDGDLVNEMFRDMRLSTRKHLPMTVLEIIEKLAKGKTAFYSIVDQMPEKKNKN